MSNKGLYSQSCAFSSSHVWMGELFHKESWVLKTWCFSTVALEKTLESPLDWKEIKPVNLQGNKSWIFIGRTDVETPILWPSDEKNWLIRKDPDAGKETEVRRRKGRQRTRWLDGITNSMDMSLSKLRRSWRIGKPGVLQSMGSQSQTQPRDWTTTTTKETS